ncbi:MAG TPA: ABC transporter permease [Bryobacteraceae bacterium]|nr:ABC transporter permease [Bryobacteraceae bacterium]
MRLAWHNIAHDRIRFAVTVLGITFAVFLMIFQFSILLGFLEAASKIVDSTDADLWIAGRGVQCFEFPVAIERRYEQIAYSIRGVAHTSSVCIRPVQFKKTDGSQQLVELIGANPDVGSRFPIPHVPGSASAIPPHALLVDNSNAQLLDVSSHLPLEVEIDEQRARVVGTTSGFSSFLGSPYVFTSYADGSRYIGLRSDQTMFILVQVQPGVAIQQVKKQLQARLPNADVWTRGEFSARARFYWISQTGAGAAILTAALLGFLIGLAVVSQAMYATTMENIEEFATLKALGATRGFVMRVIVLQAVIAGLAGYLLGVLITHPMVLAAKASIPWVSAPWWLPLGVLFPTLALCVTASLLSVRTALSVEPAKVFRA